MSNYEVEVLKKAEGKWIFRFVREILAISEKTYKTSDEAYEAAKNFIDDIKEGRVKLPK